MAPSFKVDVAPTVLVWARRTAHLSREGVARKLAPNDDKIPTWLARVQAWEDGDERPSYAQLRDLAAIYRRPLTAMLLARPPDEAREVHDFRRPAEVGELSSTLAFALREARERRDIAVELVELTRSDEPRWSATAQLTEDAEVVGARLRQQLGLSIDEQARGFPAWRAAVEAAGALVFGFQGVESRLASGFALTAGPIPVIGVNNADAPVRRSFTLLHELTHVALRGDDALCDLTEDGPSAAVEAFCNHVAGAVLVPLDELLRHPVVARHRSMDWDEPSVRGVSKTFGVSREVVLRRLLAAKRTTREHYQSWRALFRKEQTDHEAKLDAATGGPSYPRKVVSQLGRRYTQLVLAAADRELISLSDASSFLGVKVNQFDNLAAELRGEAA